MSLAENIQNAIDSIDIDDIQETNFTDLRMMVIEAKEATVFELKEKIVTLVDAIINKMQSIDSDQAETFVHAMNIMAETDQKVVKLQKQVSIINGFLKIQ